MKTVLFIGRKTKLLSKCELRKTKDFTVWTCMPDFIHIALRRHFNPNHSLFFFLEKSTIIPEHQSCCGYRGYDNRTQICTSNYKVMNRTKNKDCANTSKSCNNEFSAKRRRVSRSICNTCLWRFRRIYREIKSGKQNVCKRHST